jgi:endoglucanase
MLGRGINLGNALDAPSEEAWGVTLKTVYFRTIKDAGFNSVRIPIRWSAHTLDDPPCTIDRSFFERVDWAVDRALSRHLAAVVNVHRYAEMDKECDDTPAAFAAHDAGIRLLEFHFLIKLAWAQQNVLGVDGLCTAR